MYVREWAGLYDIYVGYAGDRALVERSQGIKRKSVRQATARIWDAAALEAATQSAGSTSLAAGGMS